MAPTVTQKYLCDIPSNGWFNDEAFLENCCQPGIGICQIHPEATSEYWQCGGATQCADGLANCYADIPGGCYCANGCAIETTITCPSGFTLCNNESICLDTINDPANCGSCGNVCESKQCNNGQCAPFQCPGNPDYNTDSNNCGACFNKCASSQTCYQGSCVDNGTKVCAWPNPIANCDYSLCPNSEAYLSCCRKSTENCSNCCTVGA